MVFDKFDLYRCSDALVDVSLSIRQMLAKHMSFDERWNPDVISLLIDKEEDLQYKVFDL
jgi:hypothetical protein